MNTGGPLSRRIIDKMAIRNINIDCFFKVETIVGFKLKDDNEYDRLVRIITEFCKKKKYKTLDELKNLIDLPKTRLIGIETNSKDLSKVIRNLDVASVEEILRNALILSLTTESLIYDYERPVILNKKNLDRSIIFYNIGGFYANY